jgi:hypothetical protein
VLKNAEQRKEPTASRLLFLFAILLHFSKKVILIAPHNGSQMGLESRLLTGGLVCGILIFL